MKELEINAERTRYIAETIGRHWERRWEIWEKTGGYWGLRYWETDKQKALETWNRIKDEPVKERDLGWIDDLDMEGV